jgi:elongator complex protein 3
MRTISGVAIVAVMTSPAPCPHGQCIPCPGGPVFGSPQSYTGHEPAAMRAEMNDFDPFRQVQARLKQLELIGHKTEKIDLIIMGGTFTARSPYYQDWFVKRCYDALNDETASSLAEAKSLNETAVHRCIGLTVETRPDWFRLGHVDLALRFGATRVELGVQSVFDDVLVKMNRGHTVTDTVMATRIAKNAGFKICYHLMPGLPGSDESREIETFKTIFYEDGFKPDMLKIYPTVVVKGTALYDQWKKGLYQPLNTDEAVKLVGKLVSLVPAWVRIQRIQRDVPAPYIDAGVQMSNLRQLVDDHMKKNKLSNNEIRARELGHLLLKEKISFEKDDILLKTEKYQASESTEFFISLQLKHQNALVGYLRLRDINQSHRFELGKNPCMIIRELKVVGQELAIGDKTKNGLQHKGFGSMLLSEAERICVEEYDKKDLFVLSGVGVKEYYRKYHDFDDVGYYLQKKL